MAYRAGIAQGYEVRDRGDGAVRNARPTMITGACVATGVGAGGMGLEAAPAVAASSARRGVEGMKAPTTKTTSGMKAAATIKTAGGTKATAVETATSATVETDAPATMKAAATATMKTTATAAAVARLGYVCEREPNACGSQDCSERQRDLFAAPRPQHIFLHLN